MRKIMMLLLVVVMLTFAGCESVSSVIEAGRPSEQAEPDIYEVNPVYGHYYYAVDRATGVVYLVYTTGSQRSMTVMLNAGGYPVTATQLGIVYDKDDGDDK